MSGSFPVFGNVLGCAEDGQDIVFKDDATLEINHVRVADRAVGRQFDRRTWTKSPAAMMILSA